MVFLLFFAAFTIIFILASLFTSLTETPLDVSVSEPVTVGTAEFKRTVESVTRSSALPLDSEVEIFNNGSIFLRDLLEELERAESSITFTNYIFKEGVMTDKTFDTLIAKAREGVEVRLLLDAVGGRKAPEDKLEELEKAGGSYTYFRPTTFRSLTRIHRRNHVRAIVIDGKIGYTGGLAFQDEWLGDGKGEEEWRDLMFKYSGSLTRATQDHFNGLWRQTDGEILTGDKFYFAPPKPGAKAGNDSSYFVSLLHVPAPDLSADLLDLIWLTLEGAREHIYLSTPYLTPPPEIVDALKAAVERGVTVEIMVPGPLTDNRLIQSATRSYYETLLEAGIKIYEYQPGRFHEKFLVADGHWSLIGSANMDNRSATLNVENIFAIEDTTLAQALKVEFENNKKVSKERTKENFQPSLFKKLYYRMVVMFAKQL